MKILTVIGARPQFIKAAAISRAIAIDNIKRKDDSKGLIVEKIVHTGQHYDSNMSEIFFQQMEIPEPDYNLGIGGKPHGAMTGEMLAKLEELIILERPQLILIYGDTNSTLAGALAASKLHIPVAHVEAGLRSYNMKMPEEINRILSDKVSTFLFCPSKVSVDNLKKEGIYGDKNFNKVFLVGDVMFDAVNYYSKKSTPSDEIKKIVDGFSGDDFILSTIHRPINTDIDKNLMNIIGALDEISKTTKIVLPLHPRAQNAFKRVTLTPKNVIVTRPVGYFDMLFLLEKCKGVITDSGGLQKESYFFNRPCITLREETEWSELIENGCSVLAGPDYTRIIEAYENFFKAPFNKVDYLYGKGDSSKQIVGILSEYYTD